MMRRWALKPRTSLRMARRCSRYAASLINRKLSCGSHRDAQLAVLLPEACLLPLQV